jgi:iron-sulfur cluster insertion protein
LDIIIQTLEKPLEINGIIGHLSCHNFDKIPKSFVLDEVAMSDIQFNNQLTDQINVSPEAVKQLLALTENEEGVNGVRIFVSGGGCGGMSYGMTFVDQPNEYDCMLDKDGLKVYVDAVALSYLEGVEIDYQTQGANASFVFKNVFANTGGSGVCGACGAAGGGCG